MRDPNKPRRPIDIKRESAASFTIGEPDAKIESMLVINDAMFVVSTKGVHQSQLADQIDPKRTNFNLPKIVQQKTIPYGSEAPFIAQTLLMARELFDTTHLGNNFDKNSALSFALKAAHEFSAAADIYAAFETDQAASIKKLESAVQGGSLSLPTIAALQSRVFSYLNHMRAICLALIEIVQLFYPKIKSNDGWRKSFDKGIAGFLQRNEQLKDTARFLCEFIGQISDLRNAAEHPDKSKFAKLVDFNVNPHGLISKPRMAIVFKGKTLVDSDVDYFMNTYLHKTGEVFEDMCALLCDANIVPFGPLETRVVTDQAEGSSGPRRYRYFSKFKEGFEPPPQPTNISG